MKLSCINISVDDSLFIKNPETTDLGKKIVENGISLMVELGYEAFTFKKLGEAIGSNESSIYRYFESKHSLLLYFVNWYWSWIEYRLVLQTHALQDKQEKLKIAIKILTEKVTEDKQISFVDEAKLYKIIMCEATKAYYIKEVDQENKKGYYRAYKRVVQRVSDMVLEINPEFKFPHMLISTIIEGSHNQYYFSEHLPSLTDVNNKNTNVVEFYTTLVQKVIS
ncbi:TetR/AcrR family transcriptional regulator [Aequorivita echinoideorum]|uniref:TetR/AcrR family transcriptional regulator n=1 Tax=Aequorivita echinoideorum TaxID=1549647 RepID=A0ABS5S468_9FLAO|nr:TetR/AcrR family transcriptional regulator [Aequorivita echinoideorum]MBT0607215.1 TetR/AcrR family transcriptional regulator [Aequorivita echinoideorum]